MHRVDGVVDDSKKQGLFIAADRRIPRQYGVGKRSQGGLASSKANGWCATRNKTFIMKQIKTATYVCRYAFQMRNA